MSYVTKISDDKVDGLERLIGKTITKIQFDDQHLIFTDTDNKKYAFMVDGDCCSHSYFYDMYGVDKLLKGNPVVGVGTVELDESDIPNNEYGETACYGYKIVTKDPVFDDLTTVFSFRNESNGYYGGSMYPTDHTDTQVPYITEDTVLNEAD